MRLKHRDVLVALSIVLLNSIWLSLPFAPFWGDVVLALPMVFFVPGYMLTEMLTHAREIDFFHRLTLSLGLSLTLDILSGFLLNIFPSGLSTQSWTALLSCLTLLFALAVVYLRGRRVHVSDIEPTDAHKETSPTIDDAVYSRASPLVGVRWISQMISKTILQPASRNLFTTVRDGCLFAFAVALVILSFLYATRGVAESPRSGFTQLWMLPSSRSVQSCALDIGIRSFENNSVTYHAVMTSNGIQLKVWPAVVLVPNQIWEQSIIVKPIVPTKNIFVQIKLYRDDNPSVVYREVHTTLFVLRSRQGTFSCGT